MYSRMGNVIALYVKPRQCRLTLNHISMSLPFDNIISYLSIRYAASSRNRPAIIGAATALKRPKPPNFCCTAILNNRLLATAHIITSPILYYPHNLSLAKLYSDATVSSVLTLPLDAPKVTGESKEVRVRLTPHSRPRLVQRQRWLFASPPKRW